VRQHRSVAYSVEFVLLNKHQIYGGAPKVNWYQVFCKSRQVHLSSSQRLLRWGGGFTGNAFKNYPNGGRAGARCLRTEVPWSWGKMWN